MTSLVLNNISYQYTKTHNQGESGAVENINLEACPGTIVALVGPSGSGKSTILRLIAGFLQPNSGTIRFGDQLLASSKQQVPPQERSVGLVFQNHALLPHMNVRENVNFGAKKGMTAAQLDAIMLELKIDKLKAKYPHEISGGESQRVSLARAMAAQSKIFLMDEPFSSIDSALRREFRNDLQRYMRHKNRITIIVTHDAEEALELADHVVVLHEGRVIQQGSPGEVYHAPQSREAAELFGEINEIEGRALVETLTGEAKDKVFIRPEQMRIAHSGTFGIEGRVIHVAYRGGFMMASVIVEGHRCLKVTTSEQFTPGQSIRIGAKSADVKPHKAL